MRKHIVIDYINLITALHLVQKNRGSNVTALFHPTSKVLESFLIKVLNIFDIKYQLERMECGNLTNNPYYDIVVETNSMVGKLVPLYESGIPSKITDYFNYKLWNILFRLLWRPNLILSYIKKYNNIDEIYISIKTSKKFLSQYQKFLSDEDCKKITFYSGIGSINDTEYSYKRSTSKKFRFLAYIFYIRIEFKKTYSKIDSLFFSHDRGTIQGWINGIKVGKFVDFTYKIVWPDKSIGQKSDNLSFRHIYWKDIFGYFLHLKNGLTRFFPLIFSIDFNAYSELVKNWVDLFLLQSFYEKHSVKIVYSNFESDFTQLALAASSDNKKIVSFSAIWSLGNFPFKGVVTFQKFADRFFIWGDWHYDLLSSSNDKSSGYIVTGYIGDIYLTQMRKDMDILHAKHKNSFNKIIAFYDTSITPDLFFNEVTARNILNTIASAATENNSLVILKMKKKKYNVYNDIIQKYATHILIDHDSASLVPALSADVVIGIENSTPVVISAVHGKNVILFDGSRTIWQHWNVAVRGITVVRSLHDLKYELVKSLTGVEKDNVYSTYAIDPFADGKAQYRMANYMKHVFSELSAGKSESLLRADTRYKKRWGDDKILINNRLDN
jgi:hypothetical protein